MSNYTSGHESRVQRLGGDRLTYPRNHVEVDNRLAWMLGRLERSFGKDAFYVHLKRDRDAVARSYNQRWRLRFGIASAYRNGILAGAGGCDPYDVCADLVETIEENIKAFLSDKPHQMHFGLETAERDWPAFWNAIGAEGDFDASMSEWKVAHNATPPQPTLLGRAVRKSVRVVQQLAG